MPSSSGAQAVQPIFVRRETSSNLRGAPLVAETLSPSTKTLRNKNVKRGATTAKGEGKRGVNVATVAVAVAAIVGGAIALTSGDGDKPASP